MVDSAWKCVRGGGLYYTLHPTFYAPSHSPLHKWYHSFSSHSPLTPLLCRSSYFTFFSRYHHEVVTGLVESDMGGVNAEIDKKITQVRAALEQATAALESVQERLSLEQSAAVIRASTP